MSFLNPHFGASPARRRRENFGNLTPQMIIFQWKIFTVAPYNPKIFRLRRALKKCGTTNLQFCVICDVQSVKSLLKNGAVLPCLFSGFRVTTPPRALIDPLHLIDDLSGREKSARREAADRNFLVFQGYFCGESVDEDTLLCSPVWVGGGWLEVGYQIGG